MPGSALPPVNACVDVWFSGYDEFYPGRVDRITAPHAFHVVLNDGTDWDIDTRKHIFKLSSVMPDPQAAHSELPEPASPVDGPSSTADDPRELAHAKPAPTEEHDDMQVDVDSDGTKHISADLDHQADVDVEDKNKIDEDDNTSPAPAPAPAPALAPTPMSLRTPATVGAPLGRPQRRTSGRVLRKSTGPPAHKERAVEKEVEPEEDKEEQEDEEEEDKNEEKQVEEYASPVVKEEQTPIQRRRRSSRVVGGAVTAAATGGGGVVERRVSTRTRRRVVDDAMVSEPRVLRRATRQTPTKKRPAVAEETEERGPKRRKRGSGADSSSTPLASTRKTTDEEKILSKHFNEAIAGLSTKAVTAIAVDAALESAKAVIKPLNDRLDSLVKELSTVCKSVKTSIETDLAAAARPAKAAPPNAVTAAALETFQLDVSEIIGGGEARIKAYSSLSQQEFESLHRLIDQQGKALKELDRLLYAAQEFGKKPKVTSGDDTNIGSTNDVAKKASTT